MRHWQLRPLAWIALGLVPLLSCGCNTSTTPPETELPASSAPATSEPTATPAGQDEPAIQSASEQPAPPQQALPAAEERAADQASEAIETAIPEVLLSEQHAALCKVQVGDPMPNVALVDLKGQEVFLSQLLGERLTILFFWSPESYMSQAQLADMGPDIAVPTSGQGVAVIGVAVNQTPEVTRQHTTSAGATFPNFADPQGEAFAAVATAKLPRTYVLDAQGKILWFDLEYSRTTRRHLQAILQHLQLER